LDVALLLRLLDIETQSRTLLQYPSFKAASRLITQASGLMVDVSRAPILVELVVKQKKNNILPMLKLLAINRKTHCPCCFGVLLGSQCLTEKHKIPLLV
jgi:hypothetical protein